MKNPLSDAIPTKARKFVYAAAFVGGLGLAAWQAASGDWHHAVGIFLADLIPALAASNVTTPAPENSDGGE